MNEKNQQAILEMIQERLSVSRLGSSMARQTDADLRVLQIAYNEIERLQEQLSQTHHCALSIPAHADHQHLMMVAMPAPSEHPFAGAQIRFDEENEQTIWLGGLDVTEEHNAWIETLPRYHQIIFTYREG